MKHGWIFILAVLTLFMSCQTDSSIRNRALDKDIVFEQNVSGTMTETARINNDGTVQADKFADMAGTGSPSFGLGLSLGAPVLGSGGAVGAPSFAFLADPDTGMYNSGSNAIRFATAGVSRLTLENDGGVLISDPGGNGGNIPHACHRVTSATVTATPAFADCAAEEIVVGGGCGSNLSTTYLYGSYPVSNTQWRCDWATAPSAGTVVIVCCDY